MKREHNHILSVVKEKSLKEIFRALINLEQ